MCSYVLAKYKVPGGSAIFGLIVYSLMFPSSVTATPNYIILNILGLIDTHWSIVLPVIGGTMGLFLMKQFMQQIPTDFIESAKLDGAGEFRIYWSIVMPLVKPAWITLVILNFQSLWNTYGSTTIYREDLKMLSYAINQIASAGVARTGTLNAVQLIMITVPIAVFIFSQSNVMETMAHSGMKERQELCDILVRLIKEKGDWDKVVVLDGNYWENFKKIRDDIKEIIEQ